jgi:Tol biopolymer transport system component
MGEVYSARDSRLHRQVAIKTLPPAFSEDATRLARFQREAQALAALSHPNIAAIYGLEESGGTIALVMELMLVVETEANAVPNSWAPDGKTLLFIQHGADKKNHLWTVTIPGGKAVRLHEGDATELNGEVSPDGHWVAYESTESGSKTRISTEGGSVPRWAHNGKELFFWNFNADRQLFVVDVQPGTVFRAGLPQLMFKAAAGTTWDVAADGKRFLVETPASGGGGRRMEVVVNWFEELNRRVPVKK